MMETLEIQVDAATARAFEAASEQDREKALILLRLWLQRENKRPARPLDEMMAVMAAEAEANGMTPEILESILNSSDDENE